MRQGVLVQLEAEPVRVLVALALCGAVVLRPAAAFAGGGGPGGATWLYTITDHLGSATLVTNPGGSLAKRRIFEPFGQVVAEAGGSSATVALFTGKKYEAQAGMYDFGARWYDAEVGRFGSADPILALRDPQSLHGYTYVRSNPLALVDPTGMTHLKSQQTGGGVAPGDEFPPGNEGTVVGGRNDLAVAELWSGPESAGLRGGLETRLTGERVDRNGIREITFTAEDPDKPKSDKPQPDQAAWGEFWSSEGLQLGDTGSTAREAAVRGMKLFVAAVAIYGGAELVLTGAEAASASLAAAVPTSGLSLVVLPAAAAMTGTGVWLIGVGLNIGASAVGRPAPYPSLPGYE